MQMMLNEVTVLIPQRPCSVESLVETETSMLAGLTAVALAKNCEWPNSTSIYPQPKLNGVNIAMMTELMDKNKWIHY